MAIKIAGEVEKSFLNSTKLTKKQLGDIAKTAANTTKAVDSTFANGLKNASKGFDGLSNAAEKAFNKTKNAAKTAVAVITAVSLATSAVGMNFESSFAGVKKTTDATVQQYEEIRRGIIDMTNVLPASASNIAEVAEAAGQLGIERDNLLSFSRVMIDLGESTNLSATDAASALAKFANITSMATDKYSNLGSVIVDLGNNFATTESDIVEMATRLAASGELAGLSEPQIMALSAAMSSVGIEAEAGGSAMSKLLKMMQVAVETGNGQLKEFASVAGMTGNQFKEAFQKDAVTGLSAFIDGLNDTERNGKSAIVLLDEMDIKEVRLSNTILSLANANSVMSNAITTANEAWEENTALANEANQRYETTESKLKILGNKFSQAGIEIYDSAKGTMREGLQVATNAMDGFLTSLTNSSDFDNFMKSVKSKIPTVIREIKKLSSTIKDFSKPFLEVGGWLLDNPGLIVGAIVGIGTALQTYKIASGIMSLTSALASFGPVGWAILGIGGVAAVITGIGVSVKKAANDAKKANLAKHFGNISLSVEELSDAAEYIIKTKSMDKLQEAMKAFDSMDSISNTIDDAISELNKANWKVSIGLELSDIEKTDYKNNISSFISETQSLLQQQQYAISLSLNVLTDDDSKGKSIREQFDNFYSDSYAELTQLGTQLSDTVNKAFEDDLLTIDEAKEIAELQQQISKITEKLASSEFEANMEVLGMKYAGGQLDAETFQNLQAELQEQVSTATAGLDDALKKSIASTIVQLSEGAIDETQYADTIKELKENYLEQVGTIELKAMNFQTDTIMQQYSDELKDAMPELQNVIQDTMNTYASDGIKQQLENNTASALESMVNQVLKNNNLDSATKDALSELYNSLLPSIESTENLKNKYKEFGLQIPNSIVEGISAAQTIGALSGSKDAVWSVLGDSMTQSEEYKTLIGTLQEQGNYIPETIANAMAENREVIKKESYTLYRIANEDLKNIFGGGFVIDVPLNINYKATNTGIPKYPLSNPYLNNVASNANGNIVTSPILTTFAEEGTEAAIPINGSKRSIDLWRTTGRMLGVYGEYNNKSNEESFSSLSARLDSTTGTTINNNQGQPVQITYSPTLQFNGGTPSKQDIADAGKMSQDEFDKMMQQYFKNNSRLSFEN